MNESEFKLIIEKLKELESQQLRELKYIINYKYCQYENSLTLTTEEKDMLRALFNEKPWKLLVELVFY